MHTQFIRTLRSFFLSSVHWTRLLFFLFFALLITRAIIQFGSTFSFFGVTKHFFCYQHSWRAFKHWHIYFHSSFIHVFLSFFTRQVNMAATEQNIFKCFFFVLLTRRMFFSCLCFGLIFFFVFRRPIRWANKIGKKIPLGESSSPHHALNLRRLRVLRWVESDLYQITANLQPGDDNVAMRSERREFSGCFYYREKRLSQVRWNEKKWIV